MKKGPNASELLAQLAKTHADVEEGIACAGTALESRTFKVNKKAFLFLTATQARLKLEASLEEAAELATHDARYQVGGLGWLKIQLDEGRPPPRALLGRWIKESHALMSGARARRR